MENIHASIFHRQRLLFALFVLVYFSARGDGARDGGGYRIIELATDSLPSLNIARSGHSTVCIDGELIVFGGHTDGFIPTATAEYYSDGEWTTVPLVYPHDHGTTLELRSDKVFLVGGHKEPLGIGHLYSAELFDPHTHTSQGFGSMDTKRAFANAIEMVDGEVVVSGNWFNDDGIEEFINVYDPLYPNAVKVKDTSYPRANPYILRISDDDAIIFSSVDNSGELSDFSIVDRLKGDAYREPLLETWHPIGTLNRRSYNHFIGNEDERKYEWLLPVENAENHQVAIAVVKGNAEEGSTPTFSILPTEQPLPDSIYGKPIIYSSLVCDRKIKVAYLIGEIDDARVVVVSIPYGTSDPSPLTIYATDSQPVYAQSTTPVLTPEGDLIFAGGHMLNNFSPSRAVTRLPLGQKNESSDEVASSAFAPNDHNGWLWIIIVLVLILSISTAIWKGRRKKTDNNKTTTSETIHADVIDGSTEDKNLSKEESFIDLFNRIELLMEDEKLYLNPNLRMSDVAARVGSNTAYVSAAINSQRGCSFTQFLTYYRVSYAQKLMRQSPECKISVISALSGFKTDSTFFRAFRSITDMSPKEWMASNHT